MKRINEYIIPIQGLADGKHEFDLRADDHLITYFSDSCSYSSSINVNIRLLKKNNMYDLCFSLDGDILLECDRCLDKYDQNIDNEFNMIIRHSDKVGDHVEGDIELRFVGHDCSQINFAKDIYEYILLSLPAKKLCNSKNCSRFLDTFSSDTTKSEKDPRWEKLSKFK
jgi:uncharacterized metal-binding protein YceD (DUF177 family)